MNENVIDIKNLTKCYGNFTLNGIDLVVPRGTIMGFVGENGAGKTTTIKLMLNQLKRDSGEIAIFGLDNIKDEMLIKDNIGVVFSENHFHNDFNAGAVGRIMAKIYTRWSDSAYTNLLNLFGLDQKKKVKGYSRGMKMKLSIAVALSHDPTLLILDEATSGLDPVVRNEILDIFMEFIQDEDKSIFISSHITSDLERIADYITYIKEGNLVFSVEKDLLLDRYGILKCSPSELKNVDPKYISGRRNSQFAVELLINDRHEVAKRHRHLTIDPARIDDIMTYYEEEK